MNAVDVIDGAIEEIQKNGLHKGWLVSPDGTKFCTVGALRKAAGSYVKHAKDGCFMVEDYSMQALLAISLAHDTLNEIIWKETGRWNEVHEANDDPNTTAEDMILFLKKAREALA